jgi:LuxR family maltose regulon positive regulatory protein
MARTMGRQRGTGPVAAGGPGGSGFLEDKLRIPRPSFPVLRRSRVTRLLDEAARHRVTLVCGPAGAGKTIACASWAGGAGLRVAWLTADAGDGRDWFWAYLSASLTRARVAPADALRTLADGPADRFALRLISTAQAFTEPVVLVLDDVHEVSDPSVLAGLDVLVRHAPPGLRLVLSARQPPDLQLARLRVAGELADISGADLACTPEEADAYFRMQGLQADPADRDELLRSTRGWMAGLRFAAMRAGQRAASPGGIGKVTALAGHEPIVTDYLWDEVLGRQHPETRHFLLRTSIAEGVCGELADALTGRSGGARTLERLSRENSLVEPYGRGQGEYRYHPLLRDALTAALHREIPDEVPLLLRRAARWYGEHGRVLNAVRCAAKAGDWDYAAEVLASAGIAAVCSPGPGELEAVLALFPAGRAADDVAVAVAWVAARLWSGDQEGTAASLETAQRALERSTPAMRRAMEPALTALQLLHAANPGLARYGGALAERAQAGVTTQAEHRALGLLWFALGVTALRGWQITAARDALRHADRQLRRRRAERTAPCGGSAAGGRPAGPGPGTPGRLSGIARLCAGQPGAG